VELVLPGWFEADVGSLHLLALGLLDVFVPLSLCTHHLVIDVADQLLGSLERKDINSESAAGHTARGRGRTSRSRAALWGVGAGRLGWAALPILCAGNLAQDSGGSCLTGRSRSRASREWQQLTDPAAL